MSEPRRRPRDREAQRALQDLVMAALERAVRHRATGSPAAPFWAILDHLALSRRSGAARDVRATLRALRDAGLIELSRPHGVQAWELTASARRRLRRARLSGSTPALPEAPQHREWRLARMLAAQERERFSAGLRERLEQATQLLDTDPPPPSDAWLELADALRRDCRRVGSAIHCLHEWVEPADELPDHDTRSLPGEEDLEPAERNRRRARRMGRRNFRLWREGR
jgi:hypothetical protein